MSDTPTPQALPPRPPNSNLPAKKTVTQSGNSEPVKLVMPQAFSMSKLKLNTKSRILMLGSPGTGKSAFGLMMPKPLILDLDNNIEGPIQFLLQEKLLTEEQMNDIIIVKPFIDGDGKLLKRSDRFQAVGRVLTHYLREYPDRQTIFIDSFTSLIQSIMDEIRRQEKFYIAEGELGPPEHLHRTVDDPLRIQDWGAFATIAEQFMIKLSSKPYHTVVSAHIKDEELGESKIFKTFIHCPGQFRERIAGMFTEGWLFTRDVKGIEGSATDDVFIQTVAGGMKSPLGLKSAKQLGARIKVDLSKVKGIFQ